MIVSAGNEYLSDNDKQKFKNNIRSLSGAIVCLIAALIYERIFPAQDVVLAIIYLIGAFLIGTPIIITAIQGVISKNVKYTMEILVSIAIITSILSGEFFLAIFIPIILTFVQSFETKSIMGGRDAIEGLKKMQADTAIILKTDDNNQSTPQEQEILATSLKCDDIIVIRPGMSLPVDGLVVFGISSIDQKSLTGESVPKTVVVGDPVFAGTVNIDGSIHVKVTKEYMDTSFQKIVKLLEESEQITIPETKIVDKFMFYYYIPVAIITAFLVWLFTGDITRAITVLIAACPCGHVIISSAPMIASLASATKKGILIKNAAFLEYLAETDYIVFDKTGTITHGILEASSFYLEKSKDFDQLITTAARVSHASLHPISKSVISLCKDKDYIKDYEIKEHIGKGLEGKKNNDHIYFGSYKWLTSLGFDLPNTYEESGTCNWLTLNNDVLGCIIFKDIPRDDAKEMVNELKNIGILKTCLLTGDRLQTAKRIQAEVGIDEMEYELLPEQKLDYVEKIMKTNIVTVIGDGINDALALSKAHTGIAMGEIGSDTAIQSADIALMNSNLCNIPYAIKLAKRTKNIIYQNIILTFAMSAIMIFLAGAGLVSPIIVTVLHSLGDFVILANSGRVILD